MMKRGWEKTVPQIEKPDDLQPIANHPVFFASMMEITKKSLRADLADAAFGKITAVYGAALSVSLDDILA